MMICNVNDIQVNDIHVHVNAGVSKCTVVRRTHWNNTIFLHIVNARQFTT